MLYIEASQINSNGGIVLLDLLLRRIKERNIDAIIYIGYGHVLNRLKYLESKNIRLVRTSLFKTFVRYVSRRNKVQKKEALKEIFQMYFSTVLPFPKFDKLLYQLFA